MRRAILVGLLFFLGCEGGKSTPEKVPRYGRPAVTISGSAIYTLGKKVAMVVGDDVSSTTARQGEDGQAISPLVSALTGYATLQKSVANYDGSVSILVDPLTPYGLLSEVLYSINLSGYSGFHFYTIGPTLRGY